MTCHFGDCREVMKRLIAEGVKVQMCDSLTEAQVVYLAGLIDGEGSLECQKAMQPHGVTHSYRIRLSFVFATAEPLMTIATWLGISVRKYPATSSNRSPRYRGDVPKEKLIPLLRRALPHLILKRKQAEIILAIESIRSANTPPLKHVGGAKFSRMPVHAIAEMDGLHFELRKLKSNKRRMSVRATVA